LALADPGQRARYLARLANYTYHLNTSAGDVAGLCRRLHELGLLLEPDGNNPFYDVASGHHGYLATTPGHLVIAIRGSGEADDWRNNLRYWQEPYWLGGHLHAGFAVAAQGITRAIQAALAHDPARYANRAIWLTGHSSGGSVALVVAQELAMAQIAVAGIYTYGAPKIGDRAFAEAYRLHDKVHAFATVGDLVPTLPPAWLAWDGWHLHLQRYVHVIKPKLLLGKSISVRAALYHLRNPRASLLEKVVGALIDFSPHSLAGAYIPNLLPPRVWKSHKGEGAPSDAT
jgi:hypothetical protein